MKIPFDIKYRPQIESGEYKVETRDGRQARIICWDRIDDDYPLVALVHPHDNSYEEEFIEEFTLLGGKYHRHQEGEITTSSRLDLFLITPDPELSEFEKCCIRLYQNGRDDVLSGYNLSDENLKECSAELLELVKKEIEKDLPRWKKCGPNTIYNTKCNFVINGIERYIILDGYMIDVDSLTKLPKED